MNEVFGEIGPVKIKLVGFGKLHKHLIDEVNIRSKVEANDLDLIIYTNADNNSLNNYIPEISSDKYNLNFDEKSFFYKRPVPFLCTNLFHPNKTCEIHLLSNNKFSLKTKIKQIASGSIKTTVENSYSLFWYIIFVLLQRYDSTFIHASILSKNNKSYVFAGTSGCGKTSLMSELMLNDTYKYQAEDFGIISSTGNSYYCSKTLTVHDSDLQYDNPLLKGALNCLNYSDRLKWKFNKILRDNNPRAKIPVRKIFSNRIQDVSKIENVFYMIRSDIKYIDINQVDVTELSRRLTSVTLREMKSYVELINLINANSPDNYIYPNINDILSYTNDIYINSFGNVNTFQLDLPFETSPDEVIQFLNSKGLLK